MQIDEQKRYLELDALRGIAALLVVFFHFTYERNQYDSIFRFGKTGVDLFFMISGFVIFMSVERISNSTQFIINRVSRLYPTYWAAVIFAFILTVLKALNDGSLNIKMELIKFFGNLTMFQFYLYIPNLDGSYWTMIVEMIFYICILILFKINLIKYTTTLGFCICSFLAILKLYFYDLHIVKILFNIIPLAQFLPLFLAGILFYKIYRKAIHLFKGYFIITSCLVYQLILFPLHETKAVNSFEYKIILVFYFILFTLFVNSKLKFIVNKVTLFLGKISFALYLTHQYISLNFILPYFYEKLHINFWIVVTLINLPIVLFIATIIAYKIEIPYSKKMKDSLRKRFN